MKPQLRFWRDLKPDQRQQLKDKHGVKVVTFEFICMVYENK